MIATSAGGLPSAHANDGALVRFIDNQLEREDFELHAHIAACESCGVRLAQLRQRSRAFAKIVLHVGDIPVRRRRFTWQRWSATLAAALAGAAIFAGIAAATPLGTWIAERVAGLVRPDHAIVSVPPAPAPRAPVPVAGVRVPLPEGLAEAWVAIEAPTGPVRLRLRLTDDTTGIAVRGIGGAASAEFRPSGSGITVSRAGAGEIQVDVPRSARRFVLRVAGRSYVVKENARLRVLTSDVDTVDTDLLFSVRP